MMMSSMSEKVDRKWWLGTPDMVRGPTAGFSQGCCKMVVVSGRSAGSTTRICTSLILYAMQEEYPPPRGGLYAPCPCWAGEADAG